MPEIAVRTIVEALQRLAPHLEGQPEAEEALREARNACTRLAARPPVVTLAGLDAIRERHALGQTTDADVGALLEEVGRWKFLLSVANEEQARCWGRDTTIPFLLFALDRCLDEDDHVSQESPTSLRETWARMLEDAEDGHSGDCIREAHACMRCAVEGYEATAGALVHFSDEADAFNPVQALLEEVARITGENQRASLSWHECGAGVKPYPAIYCSSHTGSYHDEAPHALAVRLRHERNQERTENTRLRDMVDRLSSSVDRLRTTSQALHRRAQKAEGALRRCEVIPKGAQGRYDVGDYVRACEEAERLPDVEIIHPGRWAKLWPVVQRLVDAEVGVSPEPTANPRAACTAPGRAGAHDWHTTGGTATCRACGATTALLLRPDSLT